MRSAKEIREACEKHKEIVDFYFANNGKAICDMIDKILFKLKFNVENSDFYSLGNEIFLDVICRYDDKQDFNKFLYSCLRNKFKTEMTGRTRDKRCIKISVEEKDENGNIVVKKKIIPDTSIDTPISSEDNSVTYGDMIADKITVEKEIFENQKEGFSEKMNRYLNRLSDLQKEVLSFISIGFTQNEIMEELHINQKTYEDCYAAIHSYRNTEILM